MSRILLRNGQVFNRLRSARLALPLSVGSFRHQHADSILSGANSTILEDWYHRWQQDPKSVHPSWDRFFKEQGEAGLAAPAAMTQMGESLNNSVTVASDTVKLMALLRAYRSRGHLVADLDPLKLAKHNANVVPYKTFNELNPSYYGFTETDMQREFFVGGEVPGPEMRTLQDLVTLLRKCYCGNIGYEYRHMLDRTEKDWLQDQIETVINISPLCKETRQTIYQDLAEAELFERFCANKFATAKRFGLEGGETVIPGLQALVRTASKLGVEDIVFGMPHRGRLNVLGNVMGKDLAQIFHEFNPSVESMEQFLGSGDVKYHLGTSNDREIDGRVIHLCLVANPSHLEAVDPVVVGKVRAKQTLKGDEKRTKCMSVLMHGDAAFAGQGVVAETMELSDLRDYTTGGTIHVVVNNQIGFTTDPKYARSSPYPSDIAKATAAPIFHVNGDRPDDVVKVMQLAVEYRQRFHKDVVVDVFCYRRHGHNEIDNPFFTQPLMYQAIAKHPSPLAVYRDRLIEEGVMSKEECEEMDKAVVGRFEDKFKQSSEYLPSDSDWLASRWTGFKSMNQLARIKATGVPTNLLRQLGEAICDMPPELKLHKKVKTLYTNRCKMVASDDSLVDWGMGETLAFASLLNEGFDVRLSGQDVERGTFSHRHHVLHDQETENVYLPLNNISESQSAYQVCNSNLSEFAVLGFELGYSLESPNALVLWEGQFGDFANSAQVMIDQFISSGEQKWERQSGLVMLLPHGYDGQGPEHSSARLERFLQMCDDDPDYMPEGDEILMQPQMHNMQVVNITTPANYFHVLRRQIHREYRKPLIVMSPKALLRHPLCVSPLADFGPHEEFHRVLPDTSDLVPDAEVKRVVFCSGKVYYELLKERENRGIKNIALVRLEQISPFPHHRIAEQLSNYSNAEVVWCQEEPKNMGAWFYTQPRIQTVLRNIEDSRTPNYVGRPPSAAPATGIAQQHATEQAALISGALDLD